MTAEVSTQLATVTATASFEVGTLAWVRRNGVTVRCWAKACTFHDDPCIRQALTMPEGTEFGAERVGVDEDAPVEGVDVTPAEFREIVRRMGGKYSRKDVRVD
jgi:hypothetical protein